MSFPDVSSTRNARFCNFWTFRLHGTLDSGYLAANRAFLKSGKKGVLFSRVQSEPKGADLKPCGTLLPLMIAFSALFGDRLVQRMPKLSEMVAIELQFWSLRREFEPFWAATGRVRFQDCRIPAI